MNLISLIHDVLMEIRPNRVLLDLGLTDFYKSLQTLFLVIYKAVQHRKDFLKILRSIIKYQSWISLESLLLEENEKMSDERKQTIASPYKRRSAAIGSIIQSFQMATYIKKSISPPRSSNEN